MASVTERYRGSEEEPADVPGRVCEKESTVMTVLRTPQKLNPQPSAPPVRRGPYGILSILWKVVAGSLFLDPLLWSLSHPMMTELAAERGALLCGLLTIPFLNQGWICSRVSLLRKGNRKLIDGKSKHSRKLLVALLTAGVILKPLLLGRLDNVVAAILVGFLVLGAIKSVKHTIEKDKETRELFQDSPQAHIAQWQAQLVTIVGIPFMLAIAVSLLTTYSYLSASNSTLAAAGFLTSGLLLAMLKPEKRFFVGFCARCKHPAPIAYVDYGSCPRCDERFSPSS